MTEMKIVDPARLDWEKTDGMIPAIVQHVHTGEVLMQGFMTREALAKTIETGHVPFSAAVKVACGLKAKHLVTCCNCEQSRPIAIMTVCW